jgi:hypothetical protein
MAPVSIGNHSKIVGRPADQPLIREFYRGVLGCTFTKESRAVDYIRFEQGFFLAVLYQDAVASPGAATNEASSRCSPSKTVHAGTKS